MEHIYGKIKTLDELRRIIQGLKKKDKKVAHCHGVFDLVHPGHIRHLAAAKKYGDILIVTITADAFVNKGPGRPVFNENLRAETLAAIAHVDYVAINHAPTAVNCIRSLKPDVYVKGQDYMDRGKDVTGKISEEEKTVESVGGRLVFTQEITFSSSNLINEHLSVFPPETRSYLKQIASKYSLESIFEVLEKLKSLKVLIIGESIVDQYHYCQGMDKSRKSNVVVFKYISEESFAGGSLAVANHLSGLAREVTLVTASGKDGNGVNEILAGKIKPDVKIINFSHDDLQTLVKRRFVNDNQKLFEICYLNDQNLPKETEDRILIKLRKIISDFDLVVVSDFGHGLLTKRLTRLISEKAKFLAVNSQTNGANMGFNLITKYSNVDYAALDELEVRYAAHDNTSELSGIMKKVCRQIGCRNMIITRGQNGALSLTGSNSFIASPALATSVVDAIGAGDAFFAFTAPLLAMKVPQDLVLFIGNAVGALAVQIVCNREAVDIVSLKKFITTLLK